MRFSVSHPDKEALKGITIPFLTRVLDAPTLGGIELPGGIRGYIYVDGRARHLVNGNWEVQDDVIYLARGTTRLDPFTKLGILGAIASLTGAVDEQVIIDKLSARLVQAIQESTVGIYASLLRVEAGRPTRLAIDQANCRVAAELNGAWHLSSGAPVEVDDTWIIMDF